jgi:hypothetical protein
LTWITRVAFVTLVSLVAFLTLAGATGAATVVDEVLDVCAEGLVEVVEGDNVRGDDAGLVDFNSVKWGCDKPCFVKLEVIDSTL